MYLREMFCGTIHSYTHTFYNKVMHIFGMELNFARHIFTNFGGVFRENGETRASPPESGRDLFEREISEYSR